MKKDFYYIQSARPNGKMVGFSELSAAIAKAKYDHKVYGKANPIIQNGKIICYKA